MDEKIFETIIIFKPDIDGTIKAKYLDLFSHITGTKRGVKYEDIGKRKLAYDMKGKTEGYYLTFTWKGTGENITEIERHLRIDDDVLKFMSMKLDEESTMEYNDDDFNEIPEDEAEDGIVKSEQKQEDAWNKIFNFS